VTRQLVSFTRWRADTGASLREIPLDLPPRHLLTRAVWWTICDEAVGAQRPRDWPRRAARAAEHASIGLPCDRWDIGAARGT
jgi:DEAD/DEAH box helicase domain-containing protein